MKKIAIIGGSYLQQPAVEMAQACGYEVHCFAWREGATCDKVADYFYPISIVEKEQILEKCEEIGIDGITTIASDVAVPTVCYVAERMGLIGNGYENALKSTNKYLMSRCFAEAGIPAPAFCRVKAGDDLSALSAFSLPMIVKPTDRSGSLGVEIIKQREQLVPLVTKACDYSFHQEAIVEEFIEGREVSVESISWEGRHFVLQITDKVTTGEPYFVELEHHQPSNLPKEIQEKIRSLVPRALDALHIRYGASHSEIKITPTGELFIIEIGARMGGDFIGSTLVKLSTGYDFLKGVIEVALGDFHEPIIIEHNYSGVYFLSKETQYLKPIIENWKKHPEIVEAEMTDLELRNIKCSGDRSGYFIYQNDHRLEFINHMCDV